MRWLACMVGIEVKQVEARQNDFATVHKKDKLQTMQRKRWAFQKIKTYLN